MERFVCMNCNHVGVLNFHGRCGKCDSDSVVSEHSHRQRSEFDERAIQELVKIFRSV